MHFFLPLATSAEQAERVYARIIDQLERSGFEVYQDRIYKVSYRQDDQLKSEAVGDTSAKGELVLAIFKNDIGYFICTYSSGAVWGEPTIAEHLLVESAEIFE